MEGKSLLHMKRVECQYHQQAENDKTVLKNKDAEAHVISQIYKIKVLTKTEILVKYSDMEKDC